MEITGTADGEEILIDMRNRSLFSDLNTYIDNNQGGTFAITAQTEPATSLGHDGTANNGDSFEQR